MSHVIINDYNRGSDNKNNFLMIIHSMYGQ